MELSQKSQGYIHSGGHVHSRRSVAMMRETNRSRGLLLSLLSGSHANHNAHVSRRASASQVIGTHGCNGSRRGSASNIAMSGSNIEGSKSFPSYQHHFRNNNNKHMNVGSWRQQDTRNIMLSAMMEEEDNTMMSGKQNAAARYLSGCWRPASKHTHFSSNDYPSSSNKQQHQGGFDQESAVQAELQRIAREQLIEIEQQQQSTIY
eukprot:CAMPEP_0172325518 /NCGR_PEP_ID=MMETSP1058-20130122/54258_1 /TAXON_ID=83371 /ORGANISM="Detonula confervacea, Strain CCMP 353" /LENGTH=204 /DNA_ID=CAMNT_0013042091 /DNA_START=234 /DNA_END=848 /DNA_ORIENTATION=-